MAQLRPVFLTILVPCTADTAVITDTLQGTVIASSGCVKSRNYPSDYPVGIDDKWIVKWDFVGQYATLNITLIDFEVSFLIDCH